jgi:hypothetical protein
VHLVGFHYKNISLCTMSKKKLNCMWSIHIQLHVSATYSVAHRSHKTQLITNFNKRRCVVQLIIGVYENLSAYAAETPVITNVCLLFGVVISPTGYVTYQAHVSWVQNVISIHYTALCLFYTPSSLFTTARTHRLYYRNFRGSLPRPAFIRTVLKSFPTSISVYTPRGRR